MRLIYVMDPMCGWCYGFQPELDEFLALHPDARVDWIMGGLAPDTDQPMDEGLKQTISSYWYQIEQRTRVSFNHEFWQLNTPYRSTYPACRAVIAAERIKPGSAGQMVKAIQSAYYLNAQNPALRNTLVECAINIGFNDAEFLQMLTSDETAQQLEQHLNITQQLQVRGFPALFYLHNDNQLYPLALGFSTAKELLQQFNRITAN